jgi:hypothetical protein
MQCTFSGLRMNVKRESSGGGIFTYCMKIVTWNIRGLNDLSKQREIRSMVY